MVILSMTLRVTYTVVDASRVPPSPLAVIVYCVVSFGQTLRDPLRSEVHMNGHFVDDLAGHIHRRGRVAGPAVAARGDRVLRRVIRTDPAGSIAIGSSHEWSFCR